MIHYIRHNEINKTEWDNCINQSVNRLIYAYSWYLDIVSPGWDALVKGEYEAVMPLPWKKKWGVKYIYPPFFTQQLGVFFRTNTEMFPSEDFVSAIPGAFRYVQMNLNQFNKPLNKLSIKIKINSNHEIYIGRSYKEISASFNRNCLRNIKKAENAGLTVNEIHSADVFVSFIKNNLGDNLTYLKTKSYLTLKNILESVISKNCGEMTGVFTEKEELVAVGSFLNTNDRCIFSVCASSALGKKHQAMYLLVNNQIRKYSTEKKIFDFSGSNMQGIAYFNSTFGAIAKNYPAIFINNLPWPLIYFK